MIKTWQQRCEEHPDHEGIVTEQMIRERMQEEIDELRQALAQPVDAVNMSQERVDETDKFNHITVVCHKDHDRGYEDFQGKCLLCEVERLQKREWVGLTDDEIWKCNKAETGSAVEFHICSAHQNVLDFAEAIEARLKRKNAGA
jgi:hypothetical protein